MSKLAKNLHNNKKHINLVGRNCAKRKLKQKIFNQKPTKQFNFYEFQTTRRGGELLRARN